MSNEVLNSALPSSMKFDDLGVVEITNQELLSAVAAGTANGKQDHNDGVCVGDHKCSNDLVCF